MEKELAQLRANLDRLRKRELELLQELFDVRAAAEIQSKKIDDIAKMQPVAAIDRLPVEVLSRILNFALPVARYDELALHPHQKQQLAGVSRRWRDVILNCPSLWSAICVGLSWTSSLVEIHVMRSRQHSLNIMIRPEWYDGSLLRPVLRCTHRWRSLTIHSMPHSLLSELKLLSLPCLKHVHIQRSPGFDVKFIDTNNTPALERLVLKHCHLPNTLLPSLEKLTALTLYGEIGHWLLRPQSIHLPLLRSLQIEVDNPSMLLKAIISPELSHFDHRGFPSSGSSLDFCRLLPAFSKVQYVSLRSLTSNDSVSTVCRAFPNVRHFTLGEHASGFFYGPKEDADLWGGLECVTFCSLWADALEGAVTELQEWLQRRKPTRKPLHVRFTRIKCRYNWQQTGCFLSMLYDSLHENCTFEVDEFPFAERMRMTSLTPTLHMDLPHVPPCVVNMRLGQDVPSHDSMNDFQDLAGGESSDSEEEEEEEEEDEDEEEEALFE